MLSLQSHHITDIYVMVDDMLSNSVQLMRTRKGRPCLMTSNELVTALLWNTLTVRQKTLKDIHKWLLLYHTHDFPRIPNYSAFVDQCHKATPLMLGLLNDLLIDTAELRFMDSTMLPVCKLVRAKDHKVAKDVAKWGKNHQGWHYGFKLHVSINQHNQLCGIALTPADIYDAQVMLKILNEHTHIAVGDSHYGASVMRGIIWKKYHTIIIAPPHYKQKKKIMTRWQHLLLMLRPKIEAVFDYLKEHLYLVSSFPRSVKGYVSHYVRILLAYQLLAL